MKRRTMLAAPLVANAGGARADDVSKSADFKDLFDLSLLPAPPA